MIFLIIQYIPFLFFSISWREWGTVGRDWMSKGLLNIGCRLDELAHFQMCEACEEKISPEMNRCGHRGYFYHASPQCFKCYSCKIPLMGKRFKMSKNWVFCSNECIEAAAEALAINPNPKIKPEWEIMGYIVTFCWNTVKKVLLYNKKWSIAHYILGEAFFFLLPCLLLCDDTWCDIYYLHL